VADRTGSGRSDRENSRLYGLLMTRGGRFLLIVIFVVVMLGGAIGGYLFGLDLASRDLAAAKAQVDQLLPEAQKLKRQVIDQNAAFIALQAKLTSAQAVLKAIMPTENTYNIIPNQSLVVADGHLTIGLVGLPANERVNININGKQQSAATGDTIKIAVDPSTTCQVEVQSFDMFKAVLTASCAAAKSR
jgi:hypothetical protein